jgi:hypothetical protein
VLLLQVAALLLRDCTPENSMRSSLRRFGLLAALGVVLAGCESSSPTQPSPGPCTYVLSASTLAFGPSGGSQSITVATDGHCTWTSTAGSDWIAITAGAAGSGNGTVSVNVAPNPTTTTRTGTVTIAGQAVTVRVDGLEPCALEISPATASFSQHPASGTFTVTAPAHCEWSAVSTVPWLAVTGGSPATGSGTVSYVVDRNREIAGRTGTLAVGERTFTVVQAGDATLCEYSVSPVDLAPCMRVPAPLSVSVTTADGCTWTAEASVPWVAIASGHSGSGSGVITMSVAENWAPPRQGLVMVRWPAPTAGQNVRVSQAGCFYAVTASAISVVADGGPGSFGVFQQSEPIACGGPLQNACMWVAQSTAPWITVTTPMPQFGDNPVSFMVAPNTGAARSGTIVVQDRVVTISQAGR